MKIIIIGLVGLPGAGKTTVAYYLTKTCGYTMVTLSDFIKEEAKKQGVTRFTRELLQNIGNQMRQKYGPQVLAQLALKKIRQIGAKKVVIDGIRNLFEAKFLGVENYLAFVGVTATPRIRYKRLFERKGQAWVGTYQEFLKQEEREEHLGPRETGLRVTECLRHASYKLRNEGTAKELYRAVNRLVAKVEQKARRV